MFVAKGNLPAFLALFLMMSVIEMKSIVLPFDS